MSSCINGLPFGIILERMLVIASISFAETTEIKRVMLTLWVNIVNEQVVVSNLIALFSAVPEPTSTSNELTLFLTVLLD